jgi:hypothetical protein
MCHCAFVDEGWVARRRDRKATRDTVLDPTGEVRSAIELRDHAAKNNSGRVIPLNAHLRVALSTWRTLSAGVGAVLQSERGGPRSAS